MPSVGLVAPRRAKRSYVIVKPDLLCRRTAAVDRNVFVEVRGKLPFWQMRPLAYNENDRQHLVKSVEESVVWLLLLSMCCGWVAAVGMAMMVLSSSAPWERHSGVCYERERYQLAGRCAVWLDKVLWSTFTYGRSEAVHDDILSRYL